MEWRELARFDAATEDGTPIEIPDMTGDEGDRPGSWWPAIAGRHIDKWGDDAQIEYGAEE